MLSLPYQIENSCCRILLAFFFRPVISIPMPMRNKTMLGTNVIRITASSPNTRNEMLMRKNASIAYDRFVMLCLGRPYRNGRKKIVAGMEAPRFCAQTANNPPLSVMKSEGAPCAGKSVYSMAMNTAMAKRQTIPRAML